MIPSRLLEEYETLAALADEAFERVTRDYPSEVLCRPHCSDCCHAVFGLFLVEAVSVKENFDRLPRKARREALLRAKRTQKDHQTLSERFQALPDAEMATQVLASSRIRCPLLDEQVACILYLTVPSPAGSMGSLSPSMERPMCAGRQGFKRTEPIRPLTWIVSIGDSMTCPRPSFQDMASRISMWPLF